MYKRKIERLRKQKDSLEVKYNGNETTLYNFYGGWDLGYIVGQLSVLEDMQDVYEEQKIRDYEDSIRRDFLNECLSR
tara:strand:+ start:2917 stop:3147 length:231 start_codon:yes stop_codon:yes gene_type:complete